MPNSPNLTPATSTSAAVVALLAGHGWVESSRGPTAALWTAPDGAHVVLIDDRLTPAHWEWPGVRSRVAAGLHLSIEALTATLDAAAPDHRH